jgi:Uma2 family endonuclease
METVTTLPRSRPLTRADVETMPDDGHRYELVDGTLVVTPAPSRQHQRAVRNLVVVLTQACPGAFEVLPAPFDVALSDDTVLQPDVLVARRTDFTDRGLPTAPLVAIEVLSASTRRIDLMLKRSRYEAAGCPSYWVIDPDEPSLTAWQLRGGEYVEVAHVVGDQEFEAVTPYPVTIIPARLVE